MKTLITGGCSFSDGGNPITWPNRLAASNLLLYYAHIGTGVLAQGNGLISRKIIYTVSESLKTTYPEDILVGIMWSGPSRHDFYLEDVKFSKNITDSWLYNPTCVIPHSKNNWVFIVPSWRNDFVKSYYSTFYSHIGSLIYTYEHILRVQWFLKLHNIKYFMSSFTNEVFPVEINHPDVQHLYNQIDFDNFLPVSSEDEWCRKYSGIPYLDPDDQHHPSFDHHQAFTNQIIIPFLENKKYI
jgi:hypothetical protein